MRESTKTLIDWATNKPDYYGHANTIGRLMRRADELRPFVAEVDRKGLAGQIGEVFRELRAELAAIDAALIAAIPQLDDQPVSRRD